MLFKHLALSNTQNSANGRAITVGSFDGIHIGHQKILQDLNIYAKERSLLRTLVTFCPLPPEYFNKNIFYQLMSLRDKVEYFKKYDLIDEVIVIPFSKEMILISAKYFLDDFLYSKLNMKALFVGRDFRFGYNAEGDINFLHTELGDKIHISTMDDLILAGARVSSTRVRDSLVNNDFHLAKKLLGRDYSLIGKVVYGNQLARQWGIPTINVHLQHRFPIMGIFNATAENLCTGKKYNGTASIGYRPTVGGEHIVLEVHLHNTDENLYGEFFKVSFINKMRDEIKFDSIEELRKQIEHDIVESYSFFKKIT